MTIINKSPNKVLFAKLSCGEVFRRNGITSMKIEETDCGMNAVHLIDGLAVYFEDSVEVERIKCQLVIE